MKPKYVSAEALNMFVHQMEEFPTDVMLNDPNVNDLLNGKAPEDLRDDISVYEIAESFLYLFQSRERYEICQKILENWPKLKS